MKAVDVFDGVVDHSMVIDAICPKLFTRDFDRLAMLCFWLYNMLLEFVFAATLNLMLAHWTGTRALCRLAPAEMREVYFKITSECVVQA